MLKRNKRSYIIVNILKNLCLCYDIENVEIYIYSVILSDPNNCNYSKYVLNNIIIMTEK